jgi:hypothetical protein
MLLSCEPFRNYPRYSKTLTMRGSWIELAPAKRPRSASLVRDELLGPTGIRAEPYANLVRAHRRKYHHDEGIGNCQYGLDHLLPRPLCGRHLLALYDRGALADAGPAQRPPLSLVVGVDPIPIDTGMAKTITPPAMSLQALSRPWRWT